jgi:hypothetical protein
MGVFSFAHLNHHEYDINYRSPGRVGTRLLEVLAYLKHTVNELSEI